MMSIVKCVNSYIEQNSDKFKDPNSFKDAFIVNDIISDPPDAEQIILLCEFLLSMSAISSQKEYFLDKLTTLDESIQENYFNHIEKYIKTDESPRSPRVTEYETHRRESLEKNYIKMIEQYEREQKRFTKLKEKEIESLNLRISSLEKTISEMELKYKDALREAEIAKQKEIKSSEFSFEETLKNNELTTQILLQKNEIDDLKKNHEEMIAKYIDDINKLKEKLEVAEDKLLEIDFLKKENEKMKNKTKDFQKLKEKVSDYENLIMIIDSKSKNIESISNEKKALFLNLEKNQKELISEKDKSRKLEFEKKKLEMDLIEAKSLIIRLENRKDSQVKNKDSNKSGSQILSTETSVPKYNCNILETDKFALDNLEKEGSDELNEILIRELREELEKVKQEKDSLIKEMEFMKINPSSIQAFEKLNLELKNKEKELEICKQKLENQIQISKKEYELISSSFYELALQFISIKNDMSRKLNNNFHKTWLENERAKIFPFEK